MLNDARGREEDLGEGGFWPASGEAWIRVSYGLVDRNAADGR